MSLLRVGSLVIKKSKKEDPQEGEEEYTGNALLSTLSSFAENITEYAFCIKLVQYFRSGEWKACTDAKEEIQSASVSVLNVFTVA